MPPWHLPTVGEHAWKPAIYHSPKRMKVLFCNHHHSPQSTQIETSKIHRIIYVEDGKMHWGHGSCLQWSRQQKYCLSLKQTAPRTCLTAEAAQSACTSFFRWRMLTLPQFVSDRYSGCSYADTSLFLFSRYFFSGFETNDWVELCFCCSLSHVWLFAAPWTATCQASLFFTISWSLLKLMSIESMMPSKDIILCCSLLLLPSVFPSIRVFSKESGLCIRWPQYWSFSFSISPSNEYSGLISFRIDWFDLLAVQETLKSLLQHHSSKASILWHSALFMVQLSHPYMTIGKTIALTRWTFVRKVMPLLFNMLSRLVIAFLPRNKCLLISWLQSPSAVILEPKKIKSITVSIYLPRSDETGYRDLSFLNVEL